MPLASGRRISAAVGRAYSSGNPGSLRRYAKSSMHSRPAAFKIIKLSTNVAFAVASLSFIDGHILLFALRSQAPPEMWSRHRSTEALHKISA